jgi:carbon-monoxide dehydrogenase medium subunit
VKPAPFRYERADSVEHALALLDAPGARVLAGGQSLVPLMNMRRVQPAAVVDITRVAGLSGVAAGEDALEAGALVTQMDFEAHAGRCPAVAECLPFTGHFATRNRGTVGGSIAHADPRGELPLVLLALGATVAGRHGTRVIAAGDLFAGPYRTTLEPGELLVSTTWPAGRGQAFEELAQRHGDYTLAAAACAFGPAGPRIAVGAVADRPRLCPAAARALADGASAGEAGRLAAGEVEPIEDLHGSAEYRRHVVAVLVERVVRRAWSRST